MLKVQCFNNRKSACCFIITSFGTVEYRLVKYDKYDDDDDVRDHLNRL